MGEIRDVSWPGPRLYLVGPDRKKAVADSPSEWLAIYCPSSRGYMDLHGKLVG
jgi:hypothetical protein